MNSLTVLTILLPFVVFLGFLGVGSVLVRIDRRLQQILSVLEDIDAEVAVSDE